ncbi:MAG TPA: hypothetical protein VH021_08705 [Trebonia sp.]|nr:hypothetical protein [Trebonia sp.]
MSLVAERTGITGRRGPRARVIRRTLAAIAVGGAVAGLFACYLRLSATFAAGSDGASNALEAWDLLHGNWLLRGWTLTDVSFYTTELPQYALVELARGLRPDVVHVCAATTYTLLVLAAAALARGRARGAEGWARALIAAGIMLAPQLGNGVQVLLAQPDHVGTQVLLLAIFLLVDRAPRRWRTVAALWFLLTIAIVADKIALVDAAVPLAFAGGLHAIWACSTGSGGRAEDPGGRRGRSRFLRAARALRGQWFELAVAVAACCAAGAAQLVTIIISRLGGFVLLPVETGMVAPGRVPGHLSMALGDALNLFGADVGVAQPGPQTILAWLHAPGVVLAAAAFCFAVWRVPCRADVVSDVLAVGLVVNLAGFVASVIPATPFDARELAAALPYGAVLAGRIFGPWLTGARPARGWRFRFGFPFRFRFRFRPGAAAPARALVAALVLAGGCQLAALGYEAAQPAAVSPEQALAGWLTARHLTTGLGTYTEDNITTLDSGGAVRMLTVSWHPPPAGGTVAGLYQSSASWYDPRTADANFVVTGPADGTADLIPRAEILALAGPPARSYRFDSFTIMVWNENLLTLLASPPSRTPGDIGHL